MFSSINAIYTKKKYLAISSFEGKSNLLSLVITMLAQFLYNNAFICAWTYIKHV